MLTTGDGDLLEIYNSLEFASAADSDPDPSQILSSVLGKLDEYFTPRKNELTARYKSENVSKTQVSPHRVLYY